MDIAGSRRNSVETKVRVVGKTTASTSLAKASKWWSDATNLDNILFFLEVITNKFVKYWFLCSVSKCKYIHILVIEELI